MISLSSKSRYKYVDQKKVIQVKPVKVKQEKVDLKDKQVVEDHLDNIEKKIEMVTSQLSNLEQKYKIKKEELEQEIEKKRLSWQEEKQKYIEEAKEIGFQAGYDAGKSESLKIYHNKIDEINKLANLAKKDYKTSVESSTDTILQLAITTAEKILDKKIEEDPANFTSIVEGALKTVKTDDFIDIYVHPDKYELLIQHKEQLQKSLDGQTKLQVYINHDLRDNSSIIEHSFGQIDVSVDTQLKEIHKVLQNINNGE